MSITGTWKMTMSSPLGEQNATLQIEEVSGALQGTLTGSGAPSPVEELNVSGSDVAFAADADTPVGKLRLGFTGAVAGDTFSGKYSTPFGAFDFTGTRV